MILDSLCEEKIRKNINMVVPWYLMAAFAYYHQDDPILTDDRFDKLSRMFLEFWDKIEHVHKDKIVKEDLVAGTLLLKAEDYPKLVIGGLSHLRNQGKLSPEAQNKLEIAKCLDQTKE